MHSRSLIVAALLLFAASSALASDAVDFNRDVRPLLSDKCFACHGPDEQRREAELRLDVPADALAADRMIVVSGRPGESELYRRIAGEDEDLRMPPPDTGKTLTAEQVALIGRWIEQGARWEQHWSFVPPRRGELPDVRQGPWVRTPIDRFVLARLEAARLPPSPEADRRTLIRRVTLDLTGLPPTPQEVRDFLDDDSPQAYERLVNRLLQSEHYGEHMARFWLDAARYGDTHGLHLDNYREMWPYRDWVIRAFNENLPFDQFAITQLAGDLLPDATLDQLIATGFNRCHVTTNEGGTIPEEFYVRNVVDRVETTGTVFLGLTLGCAVCHEHKFDPVSQAEFYQLFAFFNSLDGAPMDGNVKDHYPVVKVPTAEQQQELARVREQLAAVSLQRQQRLEQLEPQFQSWLAARQQASAAAGGDSEPLAAPDEGLIAWFSFDQQEGRVAGNSADAQKPGRLHGPAGWAPGKFRGAFQFSADSYVDLDKDYNFDHDQAFSLGGWVQAPPGVSAAVLSKTDVQNLRRGYELTVDRGHVEFHLVSKWQSYAIDVRTIEEVLVPGRWQHLFVTYDGSGKAAGVAVYVDGAMQRLEVKTDSITTEGNKRAITNSRPLLLGRRQQQAPFAGGRLDELRIYDRRLSEVEVAQVALAEQANELLALPAGTLSDAQIELLRRFHANRHDSELAELVARCDQLRGAEMQVMDRVATTLVFRERESPQPAFVLERGQYDRPLERVERETPAVLPRLADDLPRDRLGFARWLVSPEHPLTSRVAVNRFWQQLIGLGIVKTAEDFGSQGDPPSHPLLLDWLAVDFCESGWDVKRLQKLIVMSAVYRQSSRVSPELFARDPENRLLARGPTYRLDAEMLRDQALALSGLLVSRVGGPSVKPPQPDGLWFAVGYSGSNTVRFAKDEGPDKVYRRSLYTFWKRTAPPPQMSTFDAPSREACVVRRERTNTPLQALLLMNDPQYVEAARFLAARTIAEGGDTPEQRIAFIFELATARPPTGGELSALLSAYEDHLRQYQADPDAARELISIGETPPGQSLDATQLAAWTMVANLILNLDEVITKN